MFQKSQLFVLFLLVEMAFFVSACGDSPTENGDEEAQAIGPVLVLGDSATEDSVLAILAENGVDAQFGGMYWEWDGSGLDQASAVVFLSGYVYQETMADSVQAQLAAFVAAGGGLMTTEWMLYDSDAGFYDMVAALAPSVYDNDYDYGTETYTVVAPSHPVAEGLAPSFATPDTGWSYGYDVADPAPFKSSTVVISGSYGGDAVVAGEYGAGRTVHWNMAGQYDGDDIWSPDVRRILVNIAKYISGATG